jgi:hypothetical protein
VNQNNVYFVARHSSEFQEDPIRIGRDRSIAQVINAKVLLAVNQLTNSVVKAGKSGERI